MPETRSRVPFRGWPPLGPRIRGVAPIGPWAGGDLFVDRRRLSRDSRGRPHSGHSLGSQLGGWPQPGRLWRPRLGNHMLALSDWRSLTDMCRRHVPGSRSGGGPHWAPAFGGWPRLALRPPRLGGGPDWTSWTSPPSGRRGRLSRDSRGWPHLGRNLGSQLGVATWGRNLGGGPNRAACGDLASAITCWRSLTGAL